MFSNPRGNGISAIIPFHIKATNSHNSQTDCWPHILTFFQPSFENSASGHLDPDNWTVCP